jgi:hypothetical protein
MKNSLMGAALATFMIAGVGGAQATAVLTFSVEPTTIVQGGSGIIAGDITVDPGDTFLDGDYQLSLDNHDFAGDFFATSHFVIPFNIASDVSPGIHDLGLWVQFVFDNRSSIVDGETLIGSTPITIESGSPNVPEPTTWVLLLTGFFSAGYCARRKAPLIA